MNIRAQRPQQPVQFTTTEDDLDRASSMYQQMCAVCHGASRGKMAPFARSLSPRPPQFVVESSGRSTWMDVYVIQHGIRWTGMPSFQSLPEADVWHLALYVEGRNQPRE
jgi:high-affinity iron transporter